MAGPLTGIRIVEMAGLGPAPFAAMMLGDHGAEVIRVQRPGHRGRGHSSHEFLNRSRTRVVVADLKDPDGIEQVRALCREADGLIEGFRPGVMERLGLGPDRLLADNPRLVFGRMTGWGQDGPYAQRAGHDINYIGLTGNLHGYGRADGKPTPPANAVGDFGGGGMMLAFGMVSAILSARTTGAGQVVDCAMIDGAAILATMSWSYRAMGLWEDARGANLFDGGAHFYDSYRCADGGYIALGAVEPQFYGQVLELLGLADDAEFAAQMDRSSWPLLRQRLEALFLTGTREEWCALLDGGDTCASPILSMSEAPHDPHLARRRTFVETDGAVQPAPAPRFSGTPSPDPRPPIGTGEPLRKDKESAWHS